MISRSLGCAFSLLGAGSLLVTACSDNGSAGPIPPGMGASGSGTSMAGTGSSAGGSGSVAGSSATTGGSAGASAGVTGGGAAPLGGQSGGGTPPAGGMGGSSSGGGGAGGAAGGGAGGASTAYTIPTVAWPSAECIAKADDLVGKMTNSEKAMQMVMGQNPSTNLATSTMVGTVFSGGTEGPTGGSKPSDWAGMIDTYIAAAAASRLQIPILYGIDAVHGASKSTSTVLFPHNAGLGSSRDPQLVEDIGHATAIEAMAQGMSWAYAPSFGVSFDNRWGRVFESFSEDPDLAGLLGAAAVLGLQGRGGLGTGNPSMVACGKHFAGDGDGTYGTSTKSGSGGLVDRGNVQIDEATMRKVGIAPYDRAIKAGIGTIMVSDAAWNGANMTGHKHLITDILKGELAFKGAVATDWEAAAGAGGVVATVNAGVDVLMEPANWQNIAGQISAAIGGQISADRVNDAVHRILTVKCQAGLFGKTRDTALMSQIGSAEHRALGRKAVSESLVLLQNNKNALPLKAGGKFWVVGSGSNSLENQCGGWSVEWQNGGSMTTGTTIKAAIGKVGTVVATAAEADAAIVVLSEHPYAEFEGDSSTLNTLPPADFTLLQQARASGKPVIAIVVSGRPVLISAHLTDADAWIAAWLPGTEGDGVADVLFGTTKFTGKLSHSWPKTDAQANITVAGYDPQFKLGDGLTF